MASRDAIAIVLRDTAVRLPPPASDPALADAMTLGLVVRDRRRGLVLTGQGAAWLDSYDAAGDAARARRENRHASA